MVLQNGKKSVNVEKLKLDIVNQMTMTNRFKIPLDYDSVFALLGAAVYGEVSRRWNDFGRDEIIDDKVNLVSRWITDKDKKPWLTICGNCGNGKTTMMKAFADVIENLWLFERINGEDRRMRVKVTTAKELAAVCVKGYDDFKQLISVPMLAVDDIGTEPENLKDYGTELYPVADMIDYRYENALFTMMTTNLAPPDIAPRYGERTADRLREMSEIIAFKNDSYRRMGVNPAQRKEEQPC